MKLRRFTLRELFLLVVIAAMGCGWWVDRNQQLQRLGVRRRPGEVIQGDAPATTDVIMYFGPGMQEAK
jgi:hypothetical protein